jgi:hypothetical protein
MVCVTSDTGTPLYIVPCEVVEVYVDTLAVPFDEGFGKVVLVNDPLGVVLSINSPDDSIFIGVPEAVSVMGLVAPVVKVPLPVNVTPLIVFVVIL